MLQAIVVNDKMNHLVDHLLCARDAKDLYTRVVLPVIIIICIALRVAHQLPSMIPSERKPQATFVQGLDHRAQDASRRPPINAAMANAKGTAKPT